MEIWIYYVSLNCMAKLPSTYNIGNRLFILQFLWLPRWRLDFSSFFSFSPSSIHAFPVYSVATFVKESLFMRFIFHHLIFRRDPTPSGTGGVVVGGLWTLLLAHTAKHGPKSPSAHYLRLISNYRELLVSCGRCYWRRAVVLMKYPYRNVLGAHYQCLSIIRSAKAGTQTWFLWEGSGRWETPRKDRSMNFLVY